ncbi:hypothetical protein DM860_012637 [Cuscuta australis]|uniref:Uncharacterized protein n=1 Tax=Cuscuta australis TaxID=267555 RepID=A0A328DDB9_9ASTE|nr:hypothetical protein DM860_012637 [Cuscuta australis]
MCINWTKSFYFFRFVEQSSNMKFSFGCLLCAGGGSRKGERDVRERKTVKLERSTTTLRVVFTNARTEWVKRNRQGTDPGNIWGLHGIWLHPRPSGSNKTDISFGTNHPSFSEWSRAWNPLNRMSIFHFLKTVWDKHGSHLEHTTYSQYFDLGVRVHDDLNFQEKIEEALAGIQADVVAVNTLTWRRTDAATLLTALERRFGYSPILKAIQVDGRLYLYEVLTEIQYNEFGKDYEIEQGPSQMFISCVATDLICF